MNPNDVSYPPFPMRLPASPTRSPVRPEIGKLRIQSGKVVTTPSFPVASNSTPATPAKPDNAE